MRLLGSKAFPPFLVRYLVSRMAVSWCCGWASPLMLMFFCHLQKFLRVLPAWCVIFKSFWGRKEWWLTTHTEVWGQAQFASHQDRSQRSKGQSRQASQPPHLWPDNVSTARGIRGYCQGQGGLCFSHHTEHSRHRAGELWPLLGTAWDYVTSHLLIFQQDEAHNGDVNGVSNAWIVKQSSHLSKRVREGIRLQLGYRKWNPVPTPATWEHAHLITHKITPRCTPVAHMTVGMYAPVPARLHSCTHTAPSWQ